MENGILFKRRGLRERSAEGAYEKLRDCLLTNEPPLPRIGTKPLEDLGIALLRHKSSGDHAVGMILWAPGADEDLLKLQQGVVRWVRACRPAMRSYGHEILDLSAVNDQYELVLGTENLQDQGKRRRGFYI